MLPQLLKPQEILQQVKANVVNKPNVEFLGQLVYNPPAGAMPNLFTHSIIAFKENGSKDIQLIKTTNLKMEALSVEKFKDLKVSQANQKDLEIFAEKFGLSLTMTKRPKLG